MHKQQTHPEGWMQESWLITTAVDHILEQMKCNDMVHHRTLLQYTAVLVEASTIPIGSLWADYHRMRRKVRCGGPLEMREAEQLAATSRLINVHHLAL
jgi:hypothetical protein